MLTAETRLKCDGCGKIFPSVGIYLIPTIRKELEEVRRRSWDKGWRQYRLTNTSSNGDYCPSCQKIHQQSRVRKGGAR